MVKTPTALKKAASPETVAGTRCFQVSRYAQGYDRPPHLTTALFLLFLWRGGVNAGAGECDHDRTCAEFDSAGRVCQIYDDWLTRAVRDVLSNRSQDMDGDALREIRQIHNFSIGEHEIRGIGPRPGVHSVGEPLRNHTKHILLQCKDPDKLPSLESIKIIPTLWGGSWMVVVINCVRLEVDVRHFVICGLGS